VVAVVVVEVVGVTGVIVVVVLVVEAIVVVVTHPPLSLVVQHERQAWASCLHPKRARMNVWWATALHGRPDGPEVQSPISNVRSARVWVRQSSFCEEQDFLHS